MRLFYGIMILVFLTLVTVMIFAGDKQAPEEKNQICYDDCIQKGWEHGKWIGYQYCDCYNITHEIKEKEE